MQMTDRPAMLALFNEVVNYVNPTDIDGWEMVFATMLRAIDRPIDVFEGMPGARSLALVPEDAV